MELPWLAAALGSGLWVYSLAASLLIVEAAWPRREFRGDSARRWALHGALLAIASGIAWVIAGALAWGAAQMHGGSLEPWRGWPHLLLMVLALDATQYGIHRLSHHIPLLWRWHALHHGDVILDVGTVWRHHPAEALFGGVAIGLAAALFGATPAEVAVYASLATAVQIAAHANIRLPARAAAWASVLLVTPGLHHLHHSPHRAETDSNYGELFSLWDRLFRTLDASGRVPGEFGLDPQVRR